MTRFLRSHPGYVSLVSTVLALAVGINLLVFAIVSALWLRPLPFDDPSRVVTILQSLSTVTSLEAPALSVFDGPVAGQVVTTGFNAAFKPLVTFPESQRHLETVGVTPLYFSVLGVSVLGRAFTEADEQVGAEAVGIISDRLWTRAFGRSAAVLGSVIGATPRPLRIVGIAPPRFDGARRGERVDLWVPTRLLHDLAPVERPVERPSMMVFARLRPGQTIAVLEQKYREMRTRPDGSQVPLAIAPTIVPLTDVFGTPDSPTIQIRESGALIVVFGLSSLLLLSGCATISALVLTHYELRHTELAIKACLGASRARLARQLAAESSVIVLAGSAGAVVCGLLGGLVLPALSLPGGVNVGRLDLSVDWQLCVMALAATLITFAIATAAPLWKVTHGRLASEISIGPITTSMRSLQKRRRLLAFQAAAMTVVLIVSGLFVRTVLYSVHSAAGFDLKRTVFVTVQEKPMYTTARADPMAVGLERRAQLMGLFEQLPMVQSVAGGVAPIGADALATLRTIRVGSREEQLRIGALAGTPNLLSVLGVPLLLGRALTASDAQPAVPTPVVITRSLAERLWPQAGAIGETFSVPEVRGGSYMVVGIVGDLAFGTLLHPVAGVVVTAKGDSDFRTSSIVLQTDDSGAAIAAIRSQLPDRVVRVATGSEIVERDVAQQRLGAWVFSSFGLVTLMMGVGGVFGLVAYLAHARQREFGLIMALGATPSDIVRKVLATALGPVAAGVAAGLLVGALVSQVFVAFLVGIDAIDPGTFAGVSLVIFVSATSAALLGTRRLRTLTPSEAFRRG